MGPQADGGGLGSPDLRSAHTADAHPGAAHSVEEPGIALASITQSWPHAGPHSS